MTGSPGDPPRECPIPSGDKYIQVFANHSVKEGDALIDVRVPGVTLTLEAHPKPGTNFRVVASGGDVNVNGNGHHVVSGGPLLPMGSSHVLTFSCTPTEANPEEGGQWVPNDGSASISQADWFINPTGGSNLNSGKTAAQALKTYAEWQRRAGDFTVLTPTGGVLTINILNNLPDSDPVTFRNLLAAGSTAVIKCKEKIVRTATFSQTTNKDPATPAATGGTPWKGRDNSLALNGWTVFEGLLLKLTSGLGAGARAIVGQNLGSKTCQITNWLVNGIGGGPEGNVDGLMSPAFPNNVGPVNVTGYQVVDYASFVLGDLLVGANAAQTVPNADGTAVTGGLLFDGVHIRAALAPDGSELVATSPRVLGAIETVTSFRNAIVDPELDIPAGVGNALLSNCSFRGGLFILPGASSVGVIGGLFHPKLSTSQGGIMALPGTFALLAGDPTFIGDLANGADADIQAFGTLIVSGGVSFWNTTHAFVVEQGGQVVDPGVSIFGEFGYVPFWGDCSGGQQLLFFPGGKMDVSQQTSANAPNLPTLIMATGFGGAVATLADDQTNGVAPDGDLAHAWQHLIAVFTNARPTTWANFATLVGPASPPSLVGGFVDQPFPTPIPDPPGFVITYANAGNPGSSAGMTFTYFYQP